MSEAARPAGGRLLGATAVMASGTMVSRILGFVRTMLVAFALGNTTAQGDTFTLATVVPNSLYMIFAGGALNTVLVPQIVRHLRADDDGGEAFVNRIMTAFLLALLSVTVLALAFTPQVMGLWMGDAWHTARLAPHRSALLFMAYLTMPQVFFYGAFFLVGQVLNARDKFGPMMWAPIVNNLVQIGVLGAYAALWASQPDHTVPFTQTQTLVLGIGSTLGIIAQTAALIPSMRAIGLRYRPRFDLRGAGLGATFHLAKWAIGYVLLTQVAAVVVTRLASSATVVDPNRPGPGVLAYNEAYLTWILPHSLLTVSLATALLPAASRLAAAGDLEGVAAEITRTLRLADTFIVPAALGFGALAMPFASLVFGNGAGANDWHAVGTTLVCFAVGLIPYTLQYIYLRGYYALEDMRTAFGLQIWISAANAGLALAWVAADPDPLTVAPRLALCYSASYLLGAFITYRALRARLPGLDSRGVLVHALRALVAALPGAVAAYLIARATADAGRLVMLGGFLAAGVLFVVAYLLLARLAGVAEVGEIVGLLCRRLGRRSRPQPDAAGAVAAPEAADETAEPRLLDYPEPGEAAQATPDEAEAPSDPVEAGELIDGRFALDTLLLRRDDALTWLATDRILSRPVLVHVLPAAGRRALEILDEARRAAPTTDARFLRVLDADLAEGRPYGSYIVCEYAPGRSLELTLADGPLDETQALWVTREVADGLAAMHTQGLFHRRLNPDTVIITASGNVKIVGFLLEAALAGARPDDAPGEALDARALGEVLYAALTAHWPGRPAYGLPAAPADTRGRPLPPRLISAGVSPEASALTERILAEPRRADRLATASEIAVALDGLLGGAHAAHELDRRLAMPLEPIRFSRRARALSARVAPATDMTGEVTGPLDLTSTMAFDPFADDPAPASPPTPTSPLTGPDAENEDTPSTPVPPPDAPAPALVGAPTRGLGIRALAVLFAGVVIAGLVGAFVNTYQATRNPSGPRLVPVVSIRDFDPKADGGDAAENPQLAPQAIDGQTGTAWKTEPYGKSAAFNGKKPGVGLVLDLGTAKAVGSVRVTVGAGAEDLQVLVPKVTDPAGPSLRSVADWTPLAQSPGATGDATLALPAGTQTRYLLVYVSKLPAAADGSGFQGSIAEIEVTS